MKKQTTTNATVTREQWLQNAVALMTPLFEAQGYKVPAVRVSCGWPSSRGLSSKKAAIGECWDKKASTDSKAQIFISPRLKQPNEQQGVLSTLIHEMVHAVVGNKEKHNKVFGKCARAIGLEGKLTAIVAGETLIAKFTGWTKGPLGDYPHAELKPGFRPVAKQTTRLVKCECGECGYVARVSRKWLEEVGAPVCPGSDCGSAQMAFEIPKELVDDDNDNDNE
jgi:hypothetical protein